MSSLSDDSANLLCSAGLQGAKLVSSSPEGRFGDSEAIFQVGPILLRFVRDRGQEFLDLAFAAAKGQFFQWDEIQAGMGWKSIDDVVAKKEPDSLQQVVTQLVMHYVELNSAFSEANAEATRAKIARAAQERGRVFVEHLTTTTPKSPIAKTRRGDKNL